MDLHAIAGPLIGAVNPNQFVGVQVNVGQTEAADGSLTPAYATPGSISASIGGEITAYASGDVLTVTAVLEGSLQAGDALSGSDGSNAITAGVTILQQLSGVAGGAGTYLLNGTATSSGTLNPCEVISASTVLNVSAIASGVLQAGQTLADSSGELSIGTLITGQLSGTVGSTGLYSVSQQQTVAAEMITTSMTLVAQIQPLSAGDLRHMDMLNLQGSHRKFYIDTHIRGIVRVGLKGGDQLTTPDGNVWLVTQPVEQWNYAGFSAVIATLQDGS